MIREPRVQTVIRWAPAIGATSIIAGTLCFAPLVAAVLAHYPQQVQAPPLQMTGAGYVPAPTPPPHVTLGHFPAGVTAPQLVMTGSGYVPATTPPPHIVEGHFPASVNAPALQFTGTGAK